MKELPDNLEHLGFVIANDHEESVHNWKRQFGLCLIGWIPGPVFAHIFDDRQRASNIIKMFDYHSKLWILDLFHSDGQLIVSTHPRNRPPWLPV